MKKYKHLLTGDHQKEIECFFELEYSFMLLSAAGTVLTAGHGREHKRLTLHSPEFMALQGARGLYLFPVAAVTKYHKPGSLKQQKCIVSQFWRPEH